MPRSIRSLSRPRPATGLAVIAAVGLAMVAAALLAPPIAQSQTYHQFAEQRTVWGVPHFGDVVSNFAYVLVAVAGFAGLASRSGRSRLVDPLDRMPFLAFFTGVAAIAVGSAYYHVNPSDTTLFWDRLPMSVAFISILAAFVSDRIDRVVGTTIVLPVAILAGAASLVYWRLGAATNGGDLRFYFLVQALAFVQIPLICALLRDRLTSGRFVSAILVLYAAAIPCEQFDHAIFTALGGTVSGHTIKHVLSATAIYLVVPMLHRAPPA